jgi:hypothetical protein
MFINAEKAREDVGEFMKSYFILLIIVVLVSSCDTPQRNRMTTTVSTGSGYSAYDPSSGNNQDPSPWSTGSTSGFSGGGTSGNSQSNPPGFENCDITPNYYAASIGHTGICQSSLSETSIAIKSTVSATTRTCLIPTYKDSAGNSTYLGGPQCFIPQENVVTSGQVYKTRQGFSHLSLNGLMIMKEASLTAYFTCMDAYVAFRSSQCPQGAQTSGPCAQAARDYMTFKCNDFKATHPYLDVRLN